MLRRFLLTAMVLALAVPSGNAQTNILFQSRNIEVRSTSAKGHEWNYLMMHRTYFGFNFHKPKNPDSHGDPEKDFSRLATAFHHRRGPAGVVLEQFNWFPGAENTFQADARVPASLVGLAGVGAMGGAGLPLDFLVGTWSEPAIGVVGLEVGALASYARPLQHMHFFERDATVVEFSLPQDNKTAPFFRFVQDAEKRGANLQVFKGEPRPTLAQRGGNGFYHVLVVEPFKQGDDVLHEELLTREAVAMCMDMLTPDGILCVHISHRYYDLVPILADAAADLKLACLRGRDWNPDDHSVPFSHFMSEWVMLARDAKVLQKLKAPAGYDKAVERELRSKIPDGEIPKQLIEKRRFWSPMKSLGHNLWTDKGPNSFRGIYRSNPVVFRLHYFLWDIENTLNDVMKIDRSTVQSCTNWLHDSINALDQWSTRRLNGGVELLR